MRWLAGLELLGMWLLWFYPYVFCAPKVQKRPSITVSGPSRLGVLLEAAGIGVCFWFHIPELIRTGVVSLLVAALAAAAGCWLMWTAIQNLGRQFRIQAGLYEDHELVRTGPYNLVRHPIYASLLAMTVATGVLVAEWPALAAGLALSIIGTEIRVHTEDRLLSGRFGAEFAEYQKRVRAYVPLVR